MSRFYMIFSKLLLKKVNIIHIYFAPAYPHRRIRQSPRPTTQYAHSHRRHLANLAPHASHSCSIKQANSARPHTRARPRAPYIPTILRILFPRNIYRTHASALYSPAFFVQSLAPHVLSPSASSTSAHRIPPTPALSQKRPTRAPRCSHHFALTYLPPSPALRPKPYASALYRTPRSPLAHLRALRHAPTTSCAIAALVSHHSVSTSAPNIIAARPLFSPFHSFHFPRRRKHHTPAPLTLHASANRRIFTPAQHSKPCPPQPHRLRPHQ